MSNEFDRTGSETQPRLLSGREAATQLGILPETYAAGLRAGLFAHPDADSNRWTTQALDQAVQRLCREGFLTSPPTKRSEYIPLPYVVTYWRRLSDETHRPHTSWRHGSESKKIRHPYGSATFMLTWFQCERDYASRQQRIPVKSWSLSSKEPEASLRVVESEVKSHRRMPNRSAPFSTTEEVPLQWDMAPPSRERKLLTPEEVSTRYRGAITVGTLRNWRSMRIGPSFLKIGKAVLYPLDLLDQWDGENLVKCHLPKVHYGK